MNERGYLEGSEMATTFNMLRANDLIWSFVVNNYLLGNEPFPFDLLYWNADSTRMPARMHSFYLRNMYQENLLAQPGGISARRRADRPAPDRRRPISSPPARTTSRRGRSTYRGHPALGGPKRFVLAASGHIAGVVNPPEGGKYGHWINAELPPDAGGMARRVPPRCRLLVAGLAALGHLATATTRCRPASPATGKLKAIEDAPGSYVRVKAI